jgi:hemerythrin-like metal-binding protein
LNSFVPAGLALLDRPHRDLDRCLRDLADDVRARDVELVRGRACLLVEKLDEHFADEEEMMRAAGWPHVAGHEECHAHLLAQARRFERQVAVNPLTPETASRALNRLPEPIHFHMIATDFGFAKHVVREARDPAPGLARPGRSPAQRG